MSFKFDNNLPIYVQLVEQLKINIISGNLKPGDRLLSVRELALQNQVNPNTMQKALVELEDIGLIYTERTNGKFVTTDQKLIDKYKKKYAQELSNKFLDDMKNIGLTKEETINYLETMGGNK
jgi:DNA-binding transcriptional regulator YhcF (GntR family)